ncbi:hypothetical protein C1N62_09280 [Nissabacter sp. SGAir0207]|nr:hypothetical protein C1N62_09280 [Nissabacter sp. SGAir0207]
MKGAQGAWPAGGTPKAHVCAAQGHAVMFSAAKSLYRDATLSPGYDRNLMAWAGKMAGRLASPAQRGFNE